MTNNLKRNTIAFVLGLMVSVSALAQSDLSQTQKSNLKQAYKCGITEAKNSKYAPRSSEIGYVLAAIMWKESSAGINKSRNGDSHGAFQNRTSTVQARLKQQGVHRSQAQIAKELQNNSVAIKWASVELFYWLDVHKGNMSKAVASYNAGWNTSKGMNYSRSVMSKVNSLRNGII